MSEPFFFWRLPLFLSAFFTALLMNGSGINDDVNIVDYINSDSCMIIDQPDALMKRIVHKHRQPDVVAVTSEKSIKSPKEESSDSASDENTVAPTTGTTKSAGYRVQVFSDNNVRTAKGEARTKAQAISERFPHYRTYVVYQSPYWRLKVGDFPTMTEAETAADEIKKAFPTYAREVRIVKDRINR